MGFFLAISVYAQEGEPDATKPDIRVDDTFITTKCASCHKIDKVCKKIGKKDGAQWEAIVKGMVKRGAKLNEIEQKAASEYLASLTAETNTICPK